MANKPDYLELAKSAMVAKGGSPYGPARVNTAQATAYALIAIAESLANNARVTELESTVAERDARIKELEAATKGQTTEPHAAAVETVKAKQGEWRRSQLNNDNDTLAGATGWDVRIAAGDEILTALRENQ